MKKTGTNFSTRCLSLLVAMVMLMGLVIPAMPVQAGIIDLIPAVSPTKLWLGLALKSVPLLLKTSKAVTYAYNEQINSGYSIAEKNVFFDSFSAYNYGNAAVSKVEDLNKTMQQEFANVRDDIKNISSSISQLQTSLDGLANKIDQTFDKGTINKFKEEYIPKLASLKKAYNGMQACMESKLSTAEDIKSAFDELYEETQEFSALQNYFTGAYDVDGKNIMQTYKQYMNSVSSDNADELTAEFVMDLYSSDVLYRYCAELCYAYQIGYMNAQGKDRYSLTGVNETLYLSNMDGDLKTLLSGQSVVSAKVMDVLTEIAGAKKHCAYITDGGIVYDMDISGTRSVYKGAEYALSSIPNDILDMFVGEITYRSSDTSLATVTNTGVIDVYGGSGNFAISCYYDNVEVYSLTFEIVSKNMSGGYGQEGAPYLISTLGEYKEFMGNYGSKQGVYATLIADIDFANTGYTVGTFYATLNGDGHSLLNISTSDSALICNTNAGVIKNLRIANSSVNHRKTRTNLTVGGFAGTNNGLITNCVADNVSINASVSELNGSGISVRAGGIVGKNLGTVTCCVVRKCSVKSVSNGNITTGTGDPGDTLYSYAYAGGIAGENNSGTIEDCLCIGPAAISANASSGAYCWKYGWPVVYKHNDRIGHAYSYASGIVGYSNGGTISHSIYHSASGEDAISAVASNLGMYDNNYESHHKNCKNINVNLIHEKKDIFCGSAQSESNYRTTDLTLSNISDSERSELINRGWKFSSNTIDIEKADDIEVSNLPNLNVYTKGDTFNVAGMVIKTAGESIVGYTVSVDTSKVGDAVTVIVKKGNKSAKFTIEVNEKICQVHSWDKGVVKKYSTCSTQGETVYTCTVCKTTKTEYTPTNAHSFGSWENLNSQLHQRKCKNCSAIEQKSHNYDNNICTECGASKQSGSIPKTDARIKVSSVTCSSNASQVRVPIVIENNPGVVSVQLTVTYDEQAMELIGLEDGGILGATLHSDEYANGYKMSWGNDTANKNLTDNGTIATLVFKLKPNVSDGEYQVSLSYNYSNFDIMDVNMNCVAFEVQDGYISVTSSLIGDVNGDGKVLPNDRVILARTLAGWSDYPMDAIDQIAADVDGNGKVNQRDRMILSRYLAGWSDYSKLPYTQN